MTLPQAGILFLSNLVGGILLVLIAITWVVALVDLFRRPDLTGGAKLAWALLIIVLPLIGTIVYFFVVMPYTKAKERFFPSK